MCTWPKVTSNDVSPRTKAMINASPLNPPLDARWRNEKPSSKRHLHQTIHFLKPSLAAEHWIHFRFFFVISTYLSGKIHLMVRWRTAYLSKHRSKTRTWFSAVWYSCSFHLNNSVCHACEVVLICWKPENELCCKWMSWMTAFLVKAEFEVSFNVSLWKFQTQ